MIAWVIQQMIKHSISLAIFRAIVTGTSGNRVFIKRTGQASADAQAYPALASYTTPTTDDEVIVVKVGIGYIVLGKIVR